MPEACFSCVYHGERDCDPIACGVVNTTPERGAHHDQHKVRVDLVPSEAIFAAARVFTEGAAKYGDRNWEKGIDAWRLYNSVIRHLLKWNMGEELNDEDFGLPHLDHALASLMMLITLRMREEGRKGYEAHAPKEVNVGG